MVRARVKMPPVMRCEIGLFSFKRSMEDWIGELGVFTYPRRRCRLARGGRL